MHVALLADTAYLDEELPAFHNLVIGLIDEMVRAAQVVPADLDDAHTSPFGDQVYFRQSSMPWLNARRIAQLSEQLKKLGIDLVHALDGRLWTGAAELAAELDIPAVFSVAGQEDLGRVDRLLRSVNAQRIAFLAATEPLAAAMREKLDGDVLLANVPLGVHTSTDLGSDPRHADRPLSAVVSGNGVMDAHYQTLLESLRQIIQADSHVQFFFDSQGGDQHRVWREAEKLGLLSNISLITHRLGHREILLHADVLIHPQPLGRARSLTLQAMAHGLPIIAHADPWLDYLLDGQTAWVLHHPLAEQWAECLRVLMDDPAAGDDLGRRARRWVRENQPVSRRIAATLDAYRRLTGATLPFPAV